MFRRSLYILSVMTFLVGVAPGGLHGEDPSNRHDPGTCFGDPEDEFKPREYGLLGDFSPGGDTGWGIRQDDSSRPARSNRFRLDFLIPILRGPFER